MLLHHTETDNESIADRRRHHVQLAGRVYVGQQLLVELVYLLARVLGASHKTEANQAQLKYRHIY